MASKITSNSTVCFTACVRQKENTCIIVLLWPFVKGVHMWRVDFPDKVSIVRKARDFYIRCPYKIPGKTFPYLDVIMQGHGGAIIYLYILLYQYMYLWSLSIICIYLYLFLYLHLYPLQYLTRQCFPFVLITGVFNTAEAEFGSLSILINNAGLGVFRPPQQTYDVNVVSERDLVWWQLTQMLEPMPKPVRLSNESRITIGQTKARGHICCVSVIVQG